MANIKRNMIKLVKEVKEGEVITETYLTPVFIPFSVVYEAVDIQEDIDKNTLTEKELFDKMIDIVANKIYNKQFTTQDLLNGLHAPDAIQTLEEQVIFVSRGYQSDETKKYMEKKKLTDEDFSPAKQKEYMDKLILDYVKNGKDINEVLSMPFHFLIEILSEQNKPRQEKSLIAAFGG